jgi:hypothetical protein
MMQAPVISQPIRAGKSPSTEITNMRLDVAMNMHVLYEVAFVTKASIADVTRKGLFASVRS